MGGGDVSPDRLIPDLISSFRNDIRISIRNPKAVRPWQHVLDCVYGYYLLTIALLEGRGQGEWNFGPGQESFVEVSEIADHAKSFFGGKPDWTAVDPLHHEAHWLTLDSSKAASELGWINKLPYPECIDWTLEWELGSLKGNDTLDLTQKQIKRFLERHS